MRLSLLRRIVTACGDSFYNTCNYYYLHLRTRVLPPRLHLRKPVTFNDKIIYLKMHMRYPDAYRYADKLLVRDYVASTCGPRYLVPLVGTWKSSSEIDYEALPDQFVLKTNHGSTMNVLCHDKRTLNIGEVNRTLDRWLRTNYFDIGREYQYKDIEPRILAEQMLTPEDGGELKDYKVFCFHGEPRFVQVDIDRHTDHKRNFYDLDWKRLPFTILYPGHEDDVPRPGPLQEMLHVARVLSQPFVFARIDLYVVAERIYFGEITLHHGGGFEPILPRRYARILGNYIDLDII